MFLGGVPLIMWEGIVEDRDDPLFLGRCRVRMIGIHDKEKGKTPIDTLPWAHPVLPPDDRRNVVGYKPGDLVVGYYRDGAAGQFPLILGKLPGIPEKPANPEEGYNDPTPDEALAPGKIARPPEMIPPVTMEENEDGGKESLGQFSDPNKLPIEAVFMGQLSTEFGKKPFPYDVNGDGKYDASDARLLIDPDSDGSVGSGDNEGEFFDGTGGGEIQTVPISRYPLEHMLKESDASRLARHEKIEQTCVARKKGSIYSAPTATHTALGVGSDTPSEGETMGEPETPYNAKYPWNHVEESESGHVLEIDDTPGAERLHRYHRAGTFEEMHPDGKQVDKAVNDRYELTLGTANYSAAKDVNVTAKEFMRLHAGKTMTLEAAEDMNQDSGANRNILVGGDANTRVKKNVYTVIDGDVRILVKGNVYIATEGDFKVKAKGDILMDAENIRLTGNGQVTHKAGQAVITEGPLTYLGTMITDGTFIKAKYSDTALIADELDTVTSLPATPAPIDFVAENDADNKDNLVTASSPKEGYLWNQYSMIAGSPLAQELYKPESDSDGNVVILSPNHGQVPRLYEALPTGDLMDVTIQYKHKDFSITEWQAKRPVAKKGRFIEAGIFKGIGNGNRSHYRFKKPGSEYPTSMILQIGDRQYLIPHASQRHEAL